MSHDNGLSFSLLQHHQTHYHCHRAIAIFKRSYFCQKWVVPQNLHWGRTKVTMVWLKFCCVKSNHVIGLNMPLSVPLDVSNPTLSKCDVVSVHCECVFFPWQNVMPLSAGLFKSERKNPVPQCPPRLHVQFLTPVLWSRVPNHFLKVMTSLCVITVQYIHTIMRDIDPKYLKIHLNAECCDSFSLFYHQHYNCCEWF